MPTIPINPDQKARPSNPRGFAAFKEPGDPVMKRLVAGMAKQAGAMRKIENHNQLTRAKNNFSRAAQAYLDECRRAVDVEIDLKKAKAILKKLGEEQLGSLPKPQAGAFKSWLAMQSGKHLAALQGIMHQRVIAEADEARGRFLEQKRLDYARAAPKQRALIMHEAWDFLQQQIINLALSQEQAQAIFKAFSQKVAEESIERAMQNAQSAPDPLAVLNEIEASLVGGRFPGLDPDQGQVLLAELAEQIIQAEINQTMQGLGRALEELFDKSKGDQAVAKEMLGRAGFLKGFGLDQSHVPLLLAALDLQGKQLEKTKEKTAALKACNAAEKVLFYLEQDKEHLALGALHLFEDQLGPGVVKTLKRLVKEPDLPASGRAVEKALARIFSQDWQPDLAGLLDLGVTPKAMPLFHELHSVRQELKDSSQPDFMQRALEQFKDKFDPEQKAGQWQGRYLRILLETMQTNRLTPRNSQVIKAGLEAENQLLAWLAEHWAGQGDFTAIDQGAENKAGLQKKSEQPGDAAVKGAEQGLGLMAGFARFSGLKLTELMQRKWLIELLKLHVSARIVKERTKNVKANS